jgi:hypothetical protein
VTANTDANRGGRNTQLSRGGNGEPGRQTAQHWQQVNQNCRTAKEQREQQELWLLKHCRHVYAGPKQNEEHGREETLGYCKELFGEPVRNTVSRDCQAESKTGNHDGYLE